MSWRFFKSINIGPLRISFSKNGIGWSIGENGFRTGVNSKGKKYKSISIPGAGISKRTYENNSPSHNNKNIHWGIIVGIFILILLLKTFLK